MARAASLAALSALVLAAVSAAAAPISEQWVAGTAVPYGGPQDGVDPHVASGGLKSGSCGYGELSQSDWPYWAAVAVSPAFPLAVNASRHPLLGCGVCLEIRCDPRAGFEGRCPPGASSSSLVAFVSDTCTDCGATKLTLHYLSFQQKLASPDNGEVGVQWRQVECAPPTNITVDIDTYRPGQGGYIRLSLDSVAGSGGIQSIELRKSPLAGDRLSLAGTNWAKMTNSWGAKWELSGLPETPLDMRITSDSGEALVARQAITQAGVTGKVTLAVQFSVAGAPGVVDAETTSPIVPSNETAACNSTIVDVLRARPDMGTLLGHLDSAGMLEMLADPTASITLFSPTDDAWKAVPASVDLSDKGTLQEVLTFLIAQGLVAIPDASQMLPEDLAGGGIRVAVDTLNGKRLQVVASPSGLAVQDGSQLTPDSIIAAANLQACNSVINVVEVAVPLPF